VILTDYLALEEHWVGEVVDWALIYTAFGEWISKVGRLTLNLCAITNAARAFEVEIVSAFQTLNLSNLCVKVALGATIRTLQACSV